LRYRDFSIFQDGGRPDSFGAYLDHPHMLLGSPYNCAKFGCDRCSNSGVYDCERRTPPSISSLAMFAWRCHC